MKRIGIITTVLMAGYLGVSMQPVSCFGQNNAQRGAAVGGVAGAILGGVAGKQDNRTTRGAVIGGIAGAIAGNVIGHSQDDRLQRQYEYQQYQQYQQSQQAYQLQRSISLHDAIEMTRSGISPGVIISQIKNAGVQQEIGVSEIILLHQNGVSESVIQEMQRATIGGPPSAPPVAFQPTQRTVIIQPEPVIFERVYPSYRPVVGFEYYYSTPHYRSSRGYHHGHFR